MIVAVSWNSVLVGFVRLSISPCFSQPGHHVTRGSARGSQVEGSFSVGYTRVPLQNSLAPVEERSWRVDPMAELLCAFCLFS